MDARCYCLISLALFIFLVVFYLDQSRDFYTFKLVPRPHPKSFYDVTQSIKSDDRIVIKRRKELKRILFYTTFFGNRWPMGETIGNYSKKCGCSIDKCLFTYDRKELKNSHVVLFHARDINFDLHVVNRNRPANQLWVYFVLENPYHAPDVSYIDRFFNLTSSYRLDSDFQYPYRFHVKIDPSEAKVEERNYAVGKSRQIAWGVSNCGHQRDRLAQKLHQYGLTIDNFGNCRYPYVNSRPFPRSAKSPYNEYKFVFAAENRLCRDYVTEKYWFYAFQEDVNSIPIVLGGSNYSNPNIAIPGSFIDALKFPSPKKLAEHLLLLDKNDTMYNEYFRWKKHWKMYDPGRPTQCSPWNCDVCEKLHGEKPFKLRRNPLISNINPTKECTPYEQYFNRWVQKV